jgi:sarcosine oxidase delta subunit
MNLIDRVEDTERNLRCPHCGITDEPEFSESGPHIRANCNHCGKYLKFVKQNLPPLEREYWDNMKEQK